MHNHRVAQTISNTFLNYTSYVISLGGFLFGYDTGVVNGALSFISLPDQLNLSANLQGLVTASLVFGCTFGALFSGKLSDKYGRKLLLHTIAAIFTCATIGCALSNNIIILSIFRFILGLSVGCASSLAPVYLNEISPDRYKSQNVNKNAVAIVIGQLCAFSVNALLGTFLGHWHPVWRLMMLMAGVPAIILWLLSFNLPQSPFWQLIHSTKEKARQTFHRLGFPKLDIREAILASKTEQSHPQQVNLREVFHNKYLLYLFFAGIAVALIQQISGVNIVMYYGTTLLEQVGMGAKASLYGNVLIGLVSSIAIVLGTKLTSRFSHQHILIAGLCGNIIFMTGLTLVMRSHTFTQAQINLIVLILLTCFLATQQGIVSPTTWLLLAELFPPAVKSVFMSWATAVMWLTNFVISLVFPALVAHFGTQGVFLIFGGTNMFCVLLALLLVNPKLVKTAWQKL
ncbi:MFS transporter [Bombilactobacillus bombi]|uniref:MFS transporter n=1 Tax=Bombilactobacillus bombi TaxID=1303590 RepID=A0A417ZHP4_9LACO|nr:MFS transporter [Bombilactobacillus bombi]